MNINRAVFNSFNSRSFQQRLSNKESDEFKSNLSILPNNYYLPVNFKSLDCNYNMAKIYLKKIINEKGLPNSLKDLDLKKINGIQNGLKIFEGMNIKEIAFICQNLTEIAVYRGCSGYCAHCYAGAKAPIKEDEKHINKMSYEDYRTLMDDLKIFRERLEFNPYTAISGDMSLFRDADCLELELKDNSGRVYDFVDLSNIAYSSLEKKILFDTHGWSKSNIKLQKRAEKFVEYYSQSENADKLSQINISINPFNWFNYNAVKSLKRNDENKAKILKNAYAKRMANVLFTFTPLLNDKNFDVIVRAFPDSTVGKFANGYRESDMNDITHNILSNLAKLYVMDLNGENKVIKSKKMMYDAIDKLTSFMVEHLETDLVIGGRLTKLVSKSNFYAYTRILQEELVKDYISDISKRLFNDDNFNKIIDANGRIYLANAVAIIPTELSLNISNKDKLTAKFATKEYPTLSRKIINEALIW